MQLASKGIRVEMSECLRKENLVVFSIRVVSADFQRLAALGLVPGFVASLVQCFEFIPPLIDTALRRLTKSLLTDLPGSVKSDLSLRGGVDADVSARPSEEEADYLFEALAAIDRAAEERRKTEFGKAINEFTGKDHYQFGDITKTCITKMRRPKTLL
mmetsp:Transcript_65784/g.170041  ORF Transcript_65784/g.170041 Transcript_65784/m.170041 type:complete len:158 (-) Transcript_65784:103-576(-)